MDASVPAAATTQDDVARLVTSDEPNTSWNSSFLPTIGIRKGKRKRGGLEVSKVRPLHEYSVRMTSAVDH